MSQLWPSDMDYFASSIAALASSRRAVLEVSGGKDSMVLVELLRPYLRPQDMLVMLVTDDAPSSLLDIAMEYAHEFGPQFHLAVSESKVDREQNGDPFPIVLSDQPLFSDVAVRTRSRFDCCYRNIMVPLHEAAMEFSPDLIIRGQKDCDENRNPLPNGAVVDGVKYINPIADWSDEKVRMFLADRLPEFYEFCTDAPDCETCTGYWGRGHQAWLSHVSPEKAAIRTARIRALVQAISPVLMLGIKEVE